jgi:hypothetical protein
MKVFFGLLLVANIAFAIFQWLMPYEQLFVEQKKVPPAEQLQLLTDANTQVVSEAEVVASVEAETDALEQAVARVEQEVEAERARLVNEDNSDKRVCYTIGPIKDKARAIEISGRYSGKQAVTALKSSLEKEYQGVMVYIKGHKTRADAVRTAGKLAARGITDHIIVNSPDNKARIEKMDFKVETEARYRERTIYWLYAEQSSEVDVLQLLESTDNESGISQIPTQCLPG